MNVAITLDVAYDEDTLEEALRRMLSDEPFDSVSATKVDDEGPSGWPLVQFTGTMKDMVRLLKRYCADDTEQALEMCEVLEPAPAV